MKLVTYQAGGKNRVGAVQSEWVVDIGAALGLVQKHRVPRSLASQPAFKDAARALLAGAPAHPGQDMIAVLERGTTWFKALNEVLSGLVASLDAHKAPRGLLTPREAARLRAPIPRPGKVVAVGLNYASHAREQGKEPPSRPVFFQKASSTISGPGDAIVFPPNSTQVDYEVELAVVIGKGGKQIPEDKAYEHIAGYTILNDVSARDMQYGDRQWFRGKSCDTFGPLGPWIVTKDEVSDPHNLQISLTLNGQTMQDARTSDLVFKIPYLVSYLSQSLAWEAGDVLATGTPGGVGNYRQPQVFLKPGDTVSASVEQIGTLTNPVVGP